MKKGYGETLKNVHTVSEDWLRIDRKCMKITKCMNDRLSNNLRLNEISILTFSQFCFKINRNQLEIIVRATYGSYSNKILE